jgi:hypothetical protein
MLEPEKFSTVLEEMIVCAPEATDDYFQGWRDALDALVDRLHTPPPSQPSLLDWHQGHIL